MFSHIRRVLCGLTLIACSAGLAFRAQNSPFIGVVLQGQLGNQMFQIATAYAYALDHHLQLYVPSLSKQTKWGVPVNRETMFRRVCGKDYPYWPRAAYHEPRFGYEPLPSCVNRQIIGFFQSEKYFAHHRREILDLFAYDQKDIDLVQERYPQLVTEPHLVGVQLRSYLREDVSESHPTYGREYFRQAMSQFPPECLFVVVSDRIELAKRILSDLPHRMLFVEKQSYYHDMLVLSLCQDFVLTNSTFGWWGAWLSEAPNKRVITPSPWFGPAYAELDTKDIVPESWEIIHCPQAILDPKTAPPEAF